MGTTSGISSYRPTATTTTTLSGGTAAVGQKKFRYDEATRKLHRMLEDVLPDLMKQYALQNDN